MRTIDKETEYNEYLKEWLDSRYPDICDFYKDVHSEGHSWMLYVKKNGRQLEQLLENLKCNIEFHLIPDYNKRIIPNKFSSADQLIVYLIGLKNLISSDLHYIEENFEGEDTRYEVINLYEFATDTIAMIDRCVEANRIDENLPIPYQTLKNLLYDGNTEAFVEQLSSNLSIPGRIRKQKMNEAYFHIMVHSILTVIGFEVISEAATEKGFIDMVVELPHKIYIFEFKYSKKEKGSKFDVDLSKDALLQIKNKNYYNMYIRKLKPIVGVGVSFSETTKEINGHIAELLYSPDISIIDKFLKQTK